MGCRACYFPILATGLYALVALGMTWPLALCLSSAVAGFDGRDAFHYVWFNWWAKKALLELGTHLADVSLQYYPAGGWNPLLSASPYVALIALPLTLLLGPVTAYNLELLASFILSGLAACLLAYEATRDRCASFIGGLIFAFFPSRLGHALGGHLPHLTAYWDPLYLLFLLRLRRRPDLRHALLCGLCAALALSVSLTHVAYFIVPVTVIFAVANLLTSRGKRWLPYLALAVLFALLITIPLWVPLLGEIPRAADYIETIGTIKYSTDLLAWWTPSPHHPLLQALDLTPPLSRRLFPLDRFLEEGLGYLGAVTILLTILGVRRRWHRTGLWLTLAAVALLLSLGPVLKLGGQKTWVQLPYALLQQVPFYRWGRTPGRFQQMAMMGLAITASYGAAVLSASHHCLGRRIGVTALLSLLILAEYQVLLPFPHVTLDVPAFYTSVRQSGRAMPILDLPIVTSWGDHYAMLYQTFHEQPIIGGDIHRRLPGTEEAKEDIQRIVEPLEGMPPGLVPSAESRIRCLQEMGIRYVVLHKRGYGPDYQIQLRRFLDGLLGKPEYEDEAIIAYPVPSSSEMNWEGPLTADGQPQIAETTTVGSQRSAVMNRASMTPFKADFGGRVMLEGYRLEQRQVRPGTQVGLTLYWQARASLKSSYVVSVSLLDGGGHPWERVAGLPGGGICSTRVWQPGSLIADRHELTVPRNAPPGQYTLAVEMHDSTPSYQPVLARCTLNERLSVIWESPTEFPDNLGHRLRATLGEEIELLGYDLSAEEIAPGEVLTLTLHWRALGRIEKSYKVFTHLLDEEGRIQAQRDQVPGQGTRPTNTWLPGVVISDLYHIETTPSLPAGLYRLEVGMYDPASGRRLPVYDERGRAVPGDQVFLDVVIRVVG